MVVVTLTKQEVENILAAYRGLKDKSPFFAFNAETQEIIDKLTQAKDEPRKPLDPSLWPTEDHDGYSYKI